MALGSGRPEVVVALIDGTVSRDYLGLDRRRLRFLGLPDAECHGTDVDTACRHGTLVAGLLGARRTGAAPGICPGCTLLVRPVFGTAPCRSVATRPEELATALTEVLAAGATVVNLSLTVRHAGSLGASAGLRRLSAALDAAAARGVPIVAAADGPSLSGSSVLTLHPAVLPVVACSAGGAPLGGLPLVTTIGRSGLRAPGEKVPGTAPNGSTTARFSGASAAVPFVTGTIALLCSRFPRTSATVVRSAVAQSPFRVRRSVVPPLLDAWAAYATLGSPYLLA
ncbi:S8 family serine peptidase [Streptomyces diastatochromogenes]|uniref:S8 family serine peptidase n=1 Tax=Streptomyces diastatochromogenes TaxID=42236 RepID=UPI00142E415B|nr:S8 family serine peptidase [Streptomyces diastatochromogenes]